MMNLKERMNESVSQLSVRQSVRQSTKN